MRTNAFLVDRAGHGLFGAAALGYSEASAFTLAFRRWSGQTPMTWRDESHQG
jgi:hypothetical protein